LGLPIACRVEPANISDRRAASLLLGGLGPLFPDIRTVIADAGHESRKLARQIMRDDGWKLQIVKRRQRAFTITGLTWIVERSFAWLGRNRRFSKDYEYAVQTSEAMIDIATIRIKCRGGFMDLPCLPLVAVHGSTAESPQTRRRPDIPHEQSRLDLLSFSSSEHTIVHAGLHRHRLFRACGDSERREAEAVVATERTSHHLLAHVFRCRSPDLDCCSLGLEFQARICVDGEVLTLFNR
jgi:transposase